MDLQVLHFFVTVAQEGGFTAASEKLHYAQSNLSTRIRQMEEELGESLFYRQKRGVILTAKGEVFYEYAKRILAMSEEAESAMRDMDRARGTLRIGSIEAAAFGDLPALFSSYHRQYPDVKLSLMTDLNDVFRNLVLNRDLDGAFVAESLDHPELNEMFLKKDRLILVKSVEDQTEDIRELLQKEPLITFPEGSIFRRRLQRWIADTGIVYGHQPLILNSLGAQLVNISAGLGVGYLPESIVSASITQGLMKACTLEKEDPYSDLDILFVYRKDHIMDAAFRYFLEKVEHVAKKTEHPGMSLL